MSPLRPRVLVDADVLIAGSFAPQEQSASQVVLRMSEITLIEVVASQQAIAEAQRNLEVKMPYALATFRILAQRCVRTVPDPAPEELAPHHGLAQANDLPLLVAALREGCPWLVTFNVRDYQPGHPDVRVLRPGEFVLQVRDLLTRMGG
jgi:predicted nucleic acid-binding protein